MTEKEEPKKGYMLPDKGDAMAQQLEQKSILDISAAQLDRTFRTNIFAMFYFIKAALPHFSEGLIQLP